MTVRAIRNALEAHLASMAGLPDVGWENVAFEPPENETHLLVYLLRAGTYSPVLGGSEMTRETGVLQVSVRSPENVGTKEAEDMAEVVREHFPRGLTLTSGGVSVTIQRRGSVTPARPDGGWYRIDVSIPYFANVFHLT